MKIPKNVSSGGVHEDPHQPMAYIELKLCNVISCIGGKTGAGRKRGDAPGPSLEPRLLVDSASLFTKRCPRATA